MRAQGRAVAIASAAALVAAACGGPGDDAATAHHGPHAIGDQEDPVCGMLVRELTAPRAQVIHRDGVRLFFCSIGDLLVHLSAPSPHGRVEEAWVEVLDPAEDPAASHTGPHAWAPAEDVTYVVGVPRSGVMGEPVLAYADVASAEAVVDSKPGAQALGFDGLRRWWTERQTR